MKNKRIHHLIARTIYRLRISKRQGIAFSHVSSQKERREQVVFVPVVMQLFFYQLSGFPFRIFVTQSHLDIPISCGVPVHSIYRILLLVVIKIVTLVHIFRQHSAQDRISKQHPAVIMDTDIGILGTDIELMTAETFCEIHFSAVYIYALIRGLRLGYYAIPAYV